MCVLLFPMTLAPIEPHARGLCYTRYLFSEPHDQTPGRLGETQDMPETAAAQQVIHSHSGNGWWTKPKFFYLRDENGQPFGGFAFLLVCQPDAEERFTFHFAYSFCNPKDEFRRVTARNKTLGRLMSPHWTQEVPVNTVLNTDAHETLETLFKTVKGIPPRARELLQLDRNWKTFNALARLFHKQHGISTSACFVAPQRTH